MAPLTAAAGCAAFWHISEGKQGNHLYLKRLAGSTVAVVSCGSRQYRTTTAGRTCSVQITVVGGSRRLWRQRAAKCGVPCPRHICIGGSRAMFSHIRWQSLWSMLTATLLLAMAGCGGGSGGGAGSFTPSGCTSSSCGGVYLGLADAEGDFLTYTVDVQSLTLKKANGAIVETVPAVSRVHFA